MSRCSNEAGLGALSALLVASSKSRLLGDAVGASWRRAEVAMRRWARVGGLKEESRM